MLLSPGVPEQNVTSTRTIVSDIHRTMMKGRKGNSSGNLLVSKTHAVSITVLPLAVS